MLVSVLAISLIPIVSSIKMTAPGHVYTERENPTAYGGVANAEWCLTDWKGRRQTSGRFGANGRADLPRCAVGYYRVVAGGVSTTFAVVPCPEERCRRSASYFATDTAQSWISAPGNFDCPWHDGDSYRLISDLVWKVGVSHVRDRLSWCQTQSSACASLKLGKYLYNARLLSDRGIRISGMFHDAPDFSGRLKVLPSNLRHVYDYCARVASEFGDAMEAWEFWNEEDIGFAPEPAWDYAAAFKAASLGFKSVKPTDPVLNGALCRSVRGVYDDVLFDNGIGDYFDVFNYHTYAPLIDYPTVFSGIRSFLQQKGCSDRAIWITESGTNLEGHSTEDGVRKGLKAHSWGQELIQAEFYAKSQVELLMEGVARNYFFVFGAYNERGGYKDWGVLRRDGTVKPVYAAMSAIIRELDAATLLGEVSLGAGVKGYVFAQPDGTQTLMFWSVSPVETSTQDVLSEPDFAKQVTIAATADRCSLTDLCGRRCIVTNLTVTATRYPAYLSGLRGLPVVRHPVKQGQGSVRKAEQSAKADFSTIFRIDLNEKDFSIGGLKSTANLLSPTGSVCVSVWNLSAESKKGLISVSGGILTGLPKSVSIPAWGHVSYDCCYVPAEGGGADSHDLVIDGLFNGRRTSRLSVPVRDEAGFLSSCERMPLSWQSPDAWTRNTSAPSYRTTWDEKEGAVRFEMSWEGSSADRWFYPVYRLKAPEESVEGAAMLEFEVKAAQDKVENDFTNAYVMLLLSGGKKDRYVTYSHPIGEWERRRVDILPPGREKENVIGFRIGCNPIGKRLTYWIRNVGLLRPRVKKGTAER